MIMKHLFVLAIVLSVLGYVFADHILYYQASYMIKMQYPNQAYDAYLKIVQSYPNSRFAPESRRMLERLRKSNHRLSSRLKEEESKIEKQQKKREKVESFR